MTPESVGPLSRPVSVVRLPAEGQEVIVEASAEERAALARDFNLPAIHALCGRFRLSGSPSRVHVTGLVTARVSQTCVVTLDAFEAEIAEEVEIDFSSAEPSTSPGEEEEPPDPIVAGHIDLGAVTAEFLALGLDPYPRKPGARFEGASELRPESPFAALDRLKRNE